MLRGLDACQAIFGVVTVDDVFLRPMFFDQIAVVVVTIRDLTFLEQAVIVIVLVVCRDTIFGFRESVAHGIVAIARDARLAGWTGDRFLQQFPGGVIDVVHASAVKLFDARPVAVRIQGIGVRGNGRAV